MRSERTHALKTEDIDRARSRTDVAQPVAYGFAREGPSRARRLKRREAQRKLHGEQGGVGAAGAVGRTVGMTLAFDLNHPAVVLGVEEEIDRACAMAAGDHYGARSE